MSARVSLNWTRRFAPPSRTAFKREIVTWLGLTTISLVALVKRTDGLLKALLGGPALLCASVLVYGTYRKERGQLPFSENEQRASAERLGGFGRHVTTKDGRVVEYLVYGSNREDATVMVQMHGATSTGGLMCTWNAEMFKQLNIRGIAPTMPNSGYSDIQPDRRIANFPRDDLAPILWAEGVDEFLVDGHSLVTSHALAVAWYFGPNHAEHRCIGLGLNCPYLSTPLCDELGFRCDADDLFLVRNNDPREWHAAWNFTLADVTNLLPFASPPMAIGHMIWPKLAEERPWVLPMVAEDQKRTGARGYVGQGYEMTCYATNTLWGFDPRHIRTKHVAVWWAHDDGSPGCPPEHGKWLAELFERTEGVQTRNRSVDIGLGHWSFSPSLGPCYQAAEESLPKTLLEMTRKEAKAAPELWPEDDAEGVSRGSSGAEAEVDLQRLQDAHVEAPAR